MNWIARCKESEMKNSTITVWFLIIVSLFLLACGQQAPVPATTVAPTATTRAAPTTTTTAAPTATTKASPTAQVTKAAWEQQWADILKEAQKEGKVVITTLATSDVRNEMSRVFKSRTGVEVEYVSGRASEVAERLRTERRAGIYSVDVHLGGGTTPINQYKPQGMLDPIKPLLILPEVTDGNLWYGGKIPFVDKERSYVVTGLLAPSSPMLINTDMVKSSEIKSYKDLLTPKWKGKVIVNDPTIAGVGVRWFGFIIAQGLGVDFMRELAKQEPVVLRDQRLQVEWVARGKNPILLAPQPDVVADFARVSAPISYLTPQEGTYAAGITGVIAHFNKAPHPKAAQVFINWFLSKEGQALYSKAAGADTGRVDVDTSFLPPENRKQPNIKYFITEDEIFLQDQPKMMILAKEIFGKLLQ